MKWMWMGAVVWVAAGSAQTTFQPGCGSPQFPGAATGIDGSCPLAGSSGATSPDGLQNLSKNNFCAAGSGAAVTLSGLQSLESQAETVEKQQKLKAGTPPASRNFLETLGEGRLVSFEGYVFEARQECAETVNCGSASPNTDPYHDIHISLLANPPKSKGGTAAAQAKEECGAFVAEMIPHHRPGEWNSCNVNAVAAQKLRVRVTGQEMFDASHLICKNGAAVGDNPRRSTLWEIHPIYTFEVCPQGTCQSGGWVPLAQFAAGKTTCQTTACQ